MKLKMHLRIKQATLKTLYSYVGILSLLVNTSSPFLVSLQYTTYAQEVGVAVEETTPSEEPSDAPSEEPSGETASAEGSASTEESTPAEESVTVEAVAETSVTEEVLGTSTEDQATTETTTEPSAETSSSELPTDETQQEDILPDGVSDYRPEGVAESSPEDVTPVEPILVDSAPAIEIITDTSDVVDPLVEQIEGAVVENEKECLADGAEIVNSSSDEWIVDSEKGYAETKEPVKLGVKYIFPEEEGVSVTFSCLPKNIDDRSVLRIQEVKVSDLNLPEEFKTDAEFAYDITTDMVNGEFEYDLTLPKPEGVEAGIFSIDKSTDEVLSDGVKAENIERVATEKIKQSEEKVEGLDLDHFSIKVPEFTLGNASLVSTNSLFEGGSNSCILDVTDQYNDLNCTSNDIELAGPTAVIVDGCTSPTDYATFDLYVDLKNNAQDRYDIGVWISTDGDPNHDGSYSGACAVANLPTNSPGFNIDNDSCGDVENTSSTPDVDNAFIGRLTLLCSDVDFNGQLDVPIVTSWSNSDNSVCTNPQGTIPETKAKCKTSLDFNIPVPVPGQIIVQKETNPDASSGNFDFTLGGAATETFTLSDGEKWDSGTEVGGLSAGTYSITETSIAGWDLTSATCVSTKGDTEVASALSLQAGETITCTFTNTRRTGHIIVDKVTVPFGNTQSFNFDAGGGTYIDFSLTDGASPNNQELATGNYSVSEVPVPGWSTSYSCVSSVQDTEIIADLELDPGETITCTFTNTQLSINVIKTANPTTVPETGGDVEYTVKVENPNLVSVELTSLTDDTFGNLSGQGNCSVPQPISSGNYYECKFTKNLSGAPGSVHTNLVTATAGGATDTDDATVSFTDVLPTIEVTKTANPTSVPETGADVTFTFTVKNTSSEEPVTITSLSDSVYGILAGDADCHVGTVLAANASCTFSITEEVEGDYEGADHTNTFTGKAVDDDNTEATDTDDATVSFTDVLPTIEVTKTANPTSVPETGVDVTFTFTVKNTGPEDVILTSLTDTVFNNLDGVGDCSVPQTILMGGSYTCEYTLNISSDSLADHYNVVTAVAEDDDGTTDSATDDETVTFEDVAPSIRITKTANPTSVPETGADVTFTFLVENIGQEDVTLTSLNDTEFGDLNGKGTCVVPQTILVGGSYSCTHTVFLSSDLLLSHYNVVTATAVDDDRTQTTDDDDETVTFENVTPVVDIEKTVDEEALALPGGEFTFTLNITNNSQETVTITSLTDTNALSQQCLDLIGTSLAAGANISCQYTTTHTQVGTYENTAEITVTDDDESTGTDQDSQTVGVVSLTISKFNNSTPPEEIGDEVLFTIIVKAEGASLTDLLVIDLPSEGFDFLTGSWHASSSILERDVEQDIADNGGIYGYASPGYWPVGNISDGEIITLTYLTEIQPGVDEGDYRDIAWAKAYWGDNEVRDEGPTLVALNGFDSPLLVFAQAVNQGDLNYSNDIFVGTHVAVITPNTPPEAEAEVDEKEIEEEVLGTSTIRLPATGSDTTILVSALAVMLLGVSMITLSRKKKALLVLPILLFVSALIPGKVFAETTADPFLMVRIEDPESSFNEPFKITFVVMDASGENRNLTAVCSKDGPSSGWEDFQTISDSNFNENGGTNICNVTDAVLEGTGTYKFKVTVIAEEAEGSAVTEEVTTTYDNDGPDKPKYIEVDRKSDCKYEITLKTADDSQTDYVEVYMSDEKEFTAGPGSRIRTFDMGSNEKKTFTEEVAGERCAHRQYFAVRAFDSAGNGSDVEAEELTNVNIVTVNKEETVYEASLTSAGASSIGTGTGSEG
ncbi:hypothetical protein A3K01_03350, partial [candidate division WWE3 bacterium RIFOXYD1_FULL_43_17]